MLHKIIIYLDSSISGEISPVGFVTKTEKYCRRNCEYFIESRQFSHSTSVSVAISLCFPASFSLPLTKQVRQDTRIRIQGRLSAVDAPN